LSGIEIPETSIEGSSKSGQGQLSILSILFKTLGGTFVFGACLKIIPDLLIFVSPQILE